jgi:hypothetical protein
MQELKKAPKVGSEVSALVAGQCMFCASFLTVHTQKILQRMKIPLFITTFSTVIGL